MTQAKRADITIVGLGPGVPEHRSVEAHDIVHTARSLFLRTARVPGIEDLTARENIVVLDEVVGSRESGGADWHEAAQLVCEAAGERQVVVAIPGHPRFGERLVVEIIAEAKERDVSLEVIGGLSALDSIASALGIDPIIEMTQLLDVPVMLNGARTAAEFRSDRSYMLFRVYSLDALTAVQDRVQNSLGSEPPIAAVTLAGNAESQQITWSTLGKMHELPVGPLTTLYIPRGEVVQHG